MVGAGSYGPFGDPVTPARAEPTVGYRGELQVGALLHMRARDYDPKTGAFTTRDPLDGVDGTATVANPYHYADNDPLNRIDPTGMRAKDGDLCRGLLGSPGPAPLDDGSGRRLSPLPGTIVGGGPGGVIVPRPPTVGGGTDGLVRPRPTAGGCNPLQGPTRTPPRVGTGPGWLFPLLGLAAVAATIGPGGSSPSSSCTAPNTTGGDPCVPCPVPVGTIGAYGSMPSSSHCQRHHIIQDAAVRDVPSYSSYRAPAIMLTIPAHAAATQAQNAAPFCGTYGDERRVADLALTAAGVASPVRAAAIAAADEYFMGELGLTMASPVRVPGSRRNC